MSSKKTHMTSSKDLLFVTLQLPTFSTKSRLSADSFLFCDDRFQLCKVVDFFNYKLTI